MITDADIKKLSTVFATKDDLKQFATKDDLKEIGQKIDGLKTRIDILEDNVTGEIAKLHDENLITSSYRQRIEDHEERLNAIEARMVDA